MKTESLPQATQEQLASLGDYAKHTVHRAARFALKLHADDVHIEHLLVALLEDEESAAGQVVIHAFADPETILSEVIAMCPGSLVIGSKRSLPFSVKGLVAMEDARRIARAEGMGSIAPRQLLLAACEQLPEGSGELLEQGGFAPEEGRAEADEEPLPEEGALLRFFDGEARRALSAACHAAVRLGRDAISPVHLMLGALEVEAAGLAGLSSTRVQMLFGERDEDLTPLPERDLPLSESFLRLLAELPTGATTAPMLAWIVKNANLELKGLLERQRVTSSLLEHTIGAFRDPDCPSN